MPVTKAILKKAKKHPSYQAVIKGDPLTKLWREKEWQEELLPGVSAELLAAYLGKPSPKREDLSPFLLGWQKGVALQPYLYFDTVQVFEKAWLYSQKLKGLLPKENLWMGALAASRRMEVEICSLFHVHPTIEGVGLGLFAKESIPNNFPIGEYTGKVQKWSWSLWGIQGDYRFQYPSLSERKTHFVVDAEKQGNWTRYINHSETPNVIAVGVYSEGLLKTAIWTSRKIEKGEEVTIDYGPTYWKHRPPPRKL